jgi:hypothetical protein
MSPVQTLVRATYSSACRDRWPIHAGQDERKRRQVKLIEGRYIGFNRKPSALGRLGLDDFIDVRAMPNDGSRQVVCLLQVQPKLRRGAEIAR